MNVPIPLIVKIAIVKPSVKQFSPVLSKTSVLADFENGFIGDLIQNSDVNRRSSSAIEIVVAHRDKTHLLSYSER